MVFYLQVVTVMYSICIPQEPLIKQKALHVIKYEANSLTS